VPTVDGRLQHAACDAIHTTGYILRVSKVKNTPFCLVNHSKKNQPILMLFNIQLPEETISKTQETAFLLSGYSVAVAH